MHQELFGEKYRTQSVRLKYCDYSSSGFYFVTICTKDREEFFGEVKNGVMVLNEIGRVAQKCWLEIPNHFENVWLYEHVIMPNHVHGIIVIENTPDIPDSRGGFRGDAMVSVETPNLGVSTIKTGVSTIKTGVSTNIRSYNHTQWKPGCLGVIVNQYKRACTMNIKISGHPHFSWQSRFYEHVIRSEHGLQNIREYIMNNPAAWHRDRNNSDVFQDV